MASQVRHQRSHGVRAEAETGSVASNADRAVVTGLAVGAALATFRLRRRYRRDIDAADARLAQVHRRAIPTRWGAIEYAERGFGEPLLVLHGIYHGCDGGIFSVRDLIHDRRTIAPSRFGYLGSSLPPEATVADQADAYATLLDALGIDDVDVIGISAGTTSAFQFALRYPQRVRHLAVLVGNVPGSPTAAVQPAWARPLYGQLPMWVLKLVAPRTFVHLIGVPRGFAMTEADERFVAEFIDSMFPIVPRFPGILFDLAVSNADVTNYPLEAIEVPTLLAHTRDDPLCSYDASKRAAERISGARFLSLESGGHLMLGQTEILRTELDGFFADRSASPRQLTRDSRSARRDPSTAAPSGR